ncbi:hypothetical protein [Sphingorhabdus sp.]|uniref:hypothetical protein n=1 Tax=Sphingorhabdus sp. TaxID=1902408 RepID=UPI0035B0B0B2
MQPVLFLELNEVNFDYIQEYVNLGFLPNFKNLIDNHGYVETHSETEYEHLEPWIQWVTAHTGLTLAEHGIFRLGDIVNSDIEQVWEALADHGISVGAISPMNAICRGTKWDFFIPDPWTQTGIVADPIVRRMYRAIAQVVNDNAQERISLRSLIHLGIGAMLTVRLRSYLTLAKYFFKSFKKPWFRAILLDKLLSELYFNFLLNKSTQFSTLFLNSAAHIQHHYLFSSSIRTTKIQNPEWYVRKIDDPILDVYTAYDEILGEVFECFPNARVAVATGLHQDPHPEITFYWRLKDHAEFLTKAGIEFERVEPRMSRDFVVFCRDEVSAKRASELLAAAVTDQAEPVFEVDNRGSDLFVMLSYPGDMNEVRNIFINQRLFTNIKDDVTFVAIKNGRHNGIGYFADTGLEKGVCLEPFALSEMPARVFKMFGLTSRINS